MERGGLLCNFKDLPNVRVHADFSLALFKFLLTDPLTHSILMISDYVNNGR